MDKFEEAQQLKHRITQMEAGLEEVLPIKHPFVHVSAEISKYSWYQAFGHEDLSNGNMFPECLPSAIEFYSHVLRFWKQSKLEIAQKIKNDKEKLKELLEQCTEELK